MVGAPGWRWGGGSEVPWGPAGGQQPLRRAASVHFVIPNVLGFSVGWCFFFFDFQFSPLTLYFFLLLNLTCILSFCGVVYLAVDFLCYLVDLCVNNNV